MAMHDRLSRLLLGERNGCLPIRLAVLRQEASSIVPGKRQKKTVDVFFRATPTACRSEKQEALDKLLPWSTYCHAIKS